MKNFEEYQNKINRSLNLMESKIKFLHDGVKGLGEAFYEFQSEITDFMAFTAENYSDHEKRISELEKKIK